MSVPPLGRRAFASVFSVAIALSPTPATQSVIASPGSAPHALIAHAGDDRTVEGGETVTLDATASWDAEGHALTCAWTQIEGPATALDASDACRPSLTAPIPGVAGLPAENQVVVYRLVVSDGSATSDAEVRILVLKPFDPANDSHAIVTNTKVTNPDGSYPVGSLGYALAWADAHPGTRVTFDLPRTDPGYQAIEGTWQFNHPGHGIPMLRFIRGVTIDGFSQHRNAQARGDFVNPNGPAIVVPGVILEFGHYFLNAGTAVRSIARGLVQEMAVWSGSDLVLSGNYYNVHPRGDAALRGAWEHVGFASGGTTCGRLMIQGGTNVRIGGATPRERNLVGPSCVPVYISPRLPLTGVQFVGNYVGLDRTGTFSIDNGSPFGLATEGYAAHVMDVRIGGVTSGSRNVFSGITGGDGAQLRTSGSNNRVVVQGNYFGLNAAGTAAVPNLQGAVFMTQVLHGSGPGELVAGGPQPGAGNVMSGNTKGGLMLWRLGGTWRIAIHGNRIGTAADGLSAVANGVGVSHSASAGGVVIGGVNPGEANVISGNTGDGIRIDVVVAPAPPVRIIGNYIGVGADGTTPLGNGRSGVVSVSLGGGDPHQAHTVESNVIAYNGIHGVTLSAPNAYGRIRGNSIFSNEALGISLRGDTVLTPLPNDAGDTAGGAGNEGRNHPRLVSASISAGVLTILAQIDTLPGSDIFVDYFANDTADPSGFGEGRRYIGSAAFSLPTTAGPHLRTAHIPAAGITAADLVTATMTDARGNTSEFSAPVTVTGGDETPPSVTCPVPITLSAGASGTAAIPNVLALVSAADDVSAPAAITLSQSPAAGTALGVGTHTITVTATDAAGNSASCTTTITVVPAPIDCSTAAPSVSEIWPPNHKWVEVGILNVAGPDGRPASIVVTGILQDEPTDTTGDGNTAIDGAGVGTAVARVRAERTGTPRVPGNGRVYEILFTATSGAASCTGRVRVGVPHDQGKGPAVDDGVRYDSTVATRR